jgi:hypothetical protein
MKTILGDWIPVAEAERSPTVENHARPRWIAGCRAEKGVRVRVVEVEQHLKTNRATPGRWMATNVEIAIEAITATP